MNGRMNEQTNEEKLINYTQIGESLDHSDRYTCVDCIYMKAGDERRSAFSMEGDVDPRRRIVCELNLGDNSFPFCGIYGSLNTRMLAVVEFPRNRCP